MEEVVSVVIDNGSRMMKAGFGGDDAPRAVFPSVVGRPRHHGANLGQYQKLLYLGEEAVRMSGILNLTYPIERGEIIAGNQFEDIEKLWQHTFYDQLKVAPEEHSVVLTESPLNPKEKREKMAEIMLELFNTLSLKLSVGSVLALIGSGRSTGVVLECGESVCHSVPVYEGHHLPHAVGRFQIGGRELSNFLLKMLTELGYSFSCYSQAKECGIKMKERLGYIAFEFEKEMQVGCEIIERTYELPDEQIITIGNERFICAEPLFQPSIIGLECEGIHKITFDSVIKCDEELREQLFSNTLLCGGSSMFNGFQERLEKELNLLTPSHTKVKVFTPENRNYSAWIGGSILSTLSTFQQMCVTKQEYEEFGNKIVHRKSF